MKNIYQVESEFDSMNNYGKFFVDFLTPFFNGLVSILKSFFGGILEMLNIVKYSEIIKEYKETVSIVFIIIPIVFCDFFPPLHNFLDTRISKRFINININIPKYLIVFSIPLILYIEKHKNREESIVIMLTMFITIFFGLIFLV